MPLVERDSSLFPLRWTSVLLLGLLLFAVIQCFISEHVSRFLPKFASEEMKFFPKIRVLKDFSHSQTSNY
jgi:hypothetical protein